MKNLVNKTLIFVFFQLAFSLNVWGQQISLEQAELNSNHGLNSNLTRQCKIDSKGAVWVCHNEGLQVFPALDPASMAISTALANIPIWDVAFYHRGSASYTAAISFDKGLYIFNSKGQLVKHIPLTKARSLQWVNNEIYCISGNGVFKLNGSDTLRMTPPCRTNEQITNFFHWGGNYYACTYPSNRWIQFNNNETGKFLDWENQSPWPIDKSILSYKATDSLLFLGTEGAYYSIDRLNNTTPFQLNQSDGNNWAVWSIEECENNIYLALGNVNNLDQGGLLRHQSNTPKPIISNAVATPFLWGLTYDSNQHTLWASSLGKGSFAVNFPNGYEPLPNGRFHSDQKFVCIWRENQLNIKSHDEIKWTKHLLSENIMDVQSTANRLFVLTTDWLYEWNSEKNSFQRFLNLKNHRANKLVPAGFSLILHRPYGDWLSVNLDLKQIEKWPQSSKQTAQFITTEEFVISQEFNGSLHLVDIENQKTTTLGTLGLNANTPIAVSNNLLIAQKGHYCRVFQFTLGQMRFLYDIETSSFIAPEQDFKIFGTSRGFWVLTNSHLYQIVPLINGSIQISHQLHLGALSAPIIENAYIDKSHLWFHQSGFWKSIPLPKQARNNHPTLFSLEHKTRKSETISQNPIVVEPKNDVNIKFTHSNYWNHYYDLISLSLKNSADSMIHRQVRIGQAGNWLPGLQSGDYALYLSSSLGSEIAFLKTKTHSGFYVITLMILLMVVYRFINIRDDSKKAENQLVLLKWKTLKSNMNPHFLHNSMSLIQSLIANQQNKKAIEVTGKIAEINRLFLETNLQELATLQQELEFCRKYIQIESLRFSDRKFSFSENIDNHINLQDWSIPPLLFQPVIENAIKHGLLLDTQKGELVISILAGSDPNSIAIKITNTGPGPSFQRTHGTQMGSELVQERLDHFNRLYQESIQAEAHSGFDTQNPRLYVFTLKLKKV